MAEPAGVVRDWIRAYNERDAACMHSLITPDFRMVRPRVTVDGADAVMAFMATEWTNWADTQLDLKLTIADGPLVAAELAWVATSAVPIALPDGTRLPATGRKSNLAYVALYELKDGRLASERNFWDSMALFLQMGWPLPAAPDTAPEH